ncbi:MAG: serine/threonine-protein phosphatase [Gammaproteobacteria bacterium]|nr:serine/threonine-protein phosphatase [Gammaproteobacteria bacterium]
MLTVAFSQKGNKSEVNEDACLSFPHLGLFVVADGVGGGPSGDLASRMVVNTVYETFRDGAVSENAVVQSMCKANDRIHRTAQEQNLKGMASTVVAGWQFGSRLICFNVGDSRLYRLRDGEMVQLSRDHTRQIQKAPNVLKQVVTNAVGIKPNLQVDVSHHDCQKGDLLLLMTDGISDLLDTESMMNIVSSPLPLAEKARALVAESEQRGGQDDKTIILALMT